MGEIRYKLRPLEARQNWHFKCLLFKNYWTDLLQIFTESAKVYSHCVCEISKRSKPNYSFEDQKIGKTYENSSSFNTWVTVVKHSWIIASMSSNNRLLKFCFLFLAIYQCLRVSQFTFVEFWHVCALRALFHYLPKFRRNLQVCSFNGLSVCLSVTRYRSQFLTNQHQTWSTYGIWSNTGPYTFYRSKVK